MRTGASGEEQVIRHHTHPDRLRQALSAALLDTPRDKRIKKQY